MRLNRSQRCTIILGGLGVLIMLVFPPWVFTVDMEPYHMRMNAGYAPISDPPKPAAALKEWAAGFRQMIVVRVDIVRLLIQVAAAGMGTTLLVFLFHHRKADAP